MASPVDNHAMDDTAHTALTTYAAGVTSHDSNTVCEAMDSEAAVARTSMTGEVVTKASPAGPSGRKRKGSAPCNAMAQLKAPSRVIKTRSVAARESYLKSCKPAQKVFGITELTEAILLKGLTMQKLYQLKRVNRFFKTTIECSVQLRKVMFLESHGEENHPNPRAFTSFNPLLLHPQGLGKVRKHCHDDPVPSNEMNAEIYLAYTPIPEFGRSTGGPSTYVGRFQMSGDCVENQLAGLDNSSEECSVQSWKRTRVSAWSMPVHVCVWVTLMRCEFIVLPADSTLYDLVCRVYESRYGDVGSELIEGSRGVHFKPLPDWWVARFGRMHWRR
nr:hypothetical protein B0A51_01794 [Rachicladosporium sp. CCFEE 5018]